MLKLARTLLLVLVAVLTATTAAAFPRTPQQGIPAGVPPELEQVGVDEHLDQPIPLDAAFRDHTGKPVKLGDYFDGKRPVILNFAYHSCPVLCPLVLNQVETGLKGVGWTMGREYTVVTISVDPNDSLEKASARRAGLLADYDRAGSDAGWHFLVGDQANIDKVAKAVGFRYHYDESIQQWAHPSVLMIVKPDGNLARYLYGLEFSPNDIRLGLLEASQGRSISTVEQIILYCYHYDPKGGKYVLVATRVMQVGAAITAVLLALMLAVFWIREKRRGGLLAEPTAAPAVQPPHSLPAR